MDTSKSLRLGWIGLGSMGLAMATNIQQHIQQQQGRLPPLKYWNRTLARGKPLQELGATECATLADLVQACDVIFLSVSDDTALTNITTSIQSSSLITGKIFVNPSITTSICASFAAKKASYLAAPVFGATPVAEAGQLLVAFAGDPTAIMTVSPFLTGVIARRVLQVGANPSQALLLKTTSNFLTAGLMTLFSEAHTLAEKTGLPPSILEDLVEENLGAYCLGVSRRLTRGTYFPPEGEAPPSGLEFGIKDVEHAVGLARENDVRLRIGEMYLEAAEEARVYGEERGRKCDSSAVFGVVRQRAGLGFENEAVRERDGSTE